jgi:hypothetical protein
MSAYLTAMMEAPKEDVIAELMRAKDELASLKSENERLKESNARYRNDVDVMLEQLDEMNKLNDTITAERDSLRRVVEKLREIPSSTPREMYAKGMHFTAKRLFDAMSLAVPDRVIEQLYPNEPLFRVVDNSGSITGRGWRLEGPDGFTVYPDDQKHVAEQEASRLNREAALGECKDAD